jgi:hypothetical protein
MDYGGTRKGVRESATTGQTSFGDEEGLNLSLPVEGFELYRHKKNAEKMRARKWHGFYRARRTEQGDYEIRSVPSMLGEHSVPGASCPRRASSSITKRWTCKPPQPTL